MKIKSYPAQNLAKVIFWIENLIILISPFSTFLMGKDPTAILNNTLNLSLTVYFYIFVIIMQVIAYIAIKNLYEIRWASVVLFIVGLMTDPFYIVSALWAAIDIKRTAII
jgi:hypothetical protein